ncbi:hypothetical protein SELMODRAFT_439449 [Selaginella moellendorffii]|uniref:Uncharacterized protein n=1 Tax=Selaginella moellendorffii TaxID=88036 RepID=D8R4I7_SELML|nr:hypothetical protein SELMODRAFT_439449 [Selaginella moellendorffii]
MSSVLPHSKTCSSLLEMMLRMTLLPKFLLHACSVVSSRPYISGFDVLADFCERLSARGFCSKPLWKAYNLALMVIDLVAYFGTDYCSVTAKATTFPGLPTECQLLVVCGLALQGVPFLAVDVDSLRLDKSMRCLDVLVLAKNLIDIYLTVKLSWCLGYLERGLHLMQEAFQRYEIQSLATSILEVLELEGTSVRCELGCSIESLIPKVCKEVLRVFFVFTSVPCSQLRLLLMLLRTLIRDKWPSASEIAVNVYLGVVWMEGKGKSNYTEIEEFCSGLQPNHEEMKKPTAGWLSNLCCQQKRMKGLAGALQCFRVKESRGEWIGRSRDKRTPENADPQGSLPAVLA